MGCDIHGVFQRLNGEIWEDIESDYDQDRHYQLFAVLAGVRNGRGFAGVPTGEVVRPISEPRGLPDDFLIGSEEDHPINSLSIINPRRRKWHEDDERLYVWMGDHSHSWLNAAEMLPYADGMGTVVKTGIIDSKHYAEWDKKTGPTHYCGGVSGPGVVVIDEPEVGKTSRPFSHVRVTWEDSLKEELAYFFDEVKRLQELHGNVRFVFGFDS